MAGGLLGALTALALLVRVAPFWRLVVHPGGVVLPGADPYYHLRRLLFTVQHWPRFLDLDRWIVVPDGARAVWPPLFDWLPATLTRGLGLAPEPVAVLWPPVLGALTVWPLYAVVRRLGGRSAGLWAAAIWAVLPQAVRLSPLGRLDHHVAEILLLLLAVAATLRLHERAGAADPPTRPRPPRRAALGTAAGLALVIAATLATWPGAPLVLMAPVLGAAAFAIGAARRRGSLRFTVLFGAAHLAGALLALPLAVTAWQTGRPALSARFLSLLQPLVVCGFGALPLAALWLGRRSPARRAALAIGASAGLVAALWLWPSARASLLDGLRFLTGAQSDWFSEIAESNPLYLNARSLAFAATGLGAWAVALPLLAAAAALVAARARGRDLGWNLAAALAVLGAALGTLQLRFLGYAAPAVCAAAPLLVGRLARGGRRRAAWGLALAVGAFVPALGFWLPPLMGRPASLGLIPAPLFNLLGRVHAETPSPGDPARPDQAPSYAVFAPWYTGHWVLVIAGRPVVATNFGDYLPGGGYEATRRFFQGGDRAETSAPPPSPADLVRLLERHRARYLLSTWPAITQGPRPWRMRFAGQLHALDGSAGLGGDGTGRLRLVDESPPARLRARGAQSPPEGPLARYKLFELVRGAVIEVGAVPGERVEVACETTVRGRRFAVRRRARADRAGRARVRVAYPGLHAIGAPGGRAAAVEVSAAAVARGATLRVDLPPRARSD